MKIDSNPNDKRIFKVRSDEKLVLINFACYYVQCPSMFQRYLNTIIWAVLRLWLWQSSAAATAAAVAAE